MAMSEFCVSLQVGCPLELAQTRDSLPLIHNKQPFRCQGERAMISFHSISFASISFCPDSHLEARIWELGSRISNLKSRVRDENKSWQIPLYSIVSIHSFCHHLSARVPINLPTGPNCARCQAINWPSFCSIAPCSSC